MSTLSREGSHVSGDDEYVVVEHDASSTSGEPSDPSPPPVLSTEELDKMKYWLAYSRHGDNDCLHNKHLQARADGTCAWIRDTPEYSWWLTGQQILWISGAPGTGKSVLASSLIQHLQDFGSAPVCYFYFQRKDSSDQYPAEIPLVLARQISDSPKCPSTVLKFLSEKSKASRQHYFISSETSVNILKEVVTQTGKVFIVIDGLAEMDEKDTERFRRLVELALANPDSVKVIVAGQPSDTVKAALHEAPVLELKLTHKLLDDDIEKYVDHRMNTYEKLALEEGVRNEISHAIRSNCEGSFMYAKLMLDELLPSEPSPSVEVQLRLIEGRLRRMPRGLYHLYQRLLLRYQKESTLPESFQVLLLQWLVYSKEALHLEELLSILKLQHLPSCDGVPDTTLLAQIKSLCGHLFTISDDDETVRPFHDSVIEYLVSRRCSNSNSMGRWRFPLIDSETANRAIATNCIQYLNQDCFQEDWDFYNLDLGGLRGCLLTQNQRGPAYTERAEKYPLLRYSSENWARHAAALTVEDSDLFRDLDLFLNIEAPTFIAWNKFYWFQRLDNPREKFGPLHVASYFGMTQYTKHLLKNGSPTEQLAERCIGPLQYAAEQNHTDTLKVLLEGGADPNQGEGNRMTPLHYAATKGNHEMARLLLQHGADPDPRYKEPNVQWTEGEYRTPIHYACQGRHVDVVKELLKHIDKSKSPVLHWAAENRSHEIVEVLVAAGCDVNGKDEAGRTPLILAARVGHFETMEMLLRLGADPNLACSVTHCHTTYEKVTPLHAYCGRERYGSGGEESSFEAERIVSSLLNAGANLEAKDGDGQTPLFYAVKEYNMFDTANYLVNTCHASVKMKRNDQQSPLHVCSSGKAAKLLLEAGANIEDHDEKGRTPLMTSASTLMWEDVWSELLHAGADVNARDFDGTPVLQTMIQCSGYRHAEQAKILFDAGADANASDAEGKTVLHHFSRSLDSVDRMLPLINLFIERGCGVNGKDSMGRTPIYTWAEIGWTGVVKTLCTAGAQLNIRDFNGQTPLHAAVGMNPRPFVDRYGKEKKAKTATLLIEKGADVGAVDHLGNNILSTAIASDSYKRETLDALKNVPGVLPRLNFKRRTLIHLACMKPDGWLALKDVISAFPDIDINAVDQDGRCAMHYASALSEYHIQTLLDAGCDISRKDREGRTALHYACRARLPNGVIILGREYHKMHLLDSVDKFGRTPHMDACRSGVLQSVEAFVKWRADFNIKDSRNRNLLHAAAEFGDEEKLWALLNPREETAKGRRVGGIHVEDVTRPSSRRRPYGGRYDKDEEAYSSPNDTTPTLLRDVVTLLLEEGVSPDDTDEAGLTPAHVAAMNGTTEYIEAAAARKRLLNDWTEHPGKFSDPSVALAFLTCMTSVQAPFFITSPHVDQDLLAGMLSLAVERCQAREAFYLLYNGVKLDSFNAEGTSPLHIAALNGWRSIITLARRIGNDVDIDLRNKKGFTPLHVACTAKHGNSEMIKFLVELGADVNAAVVDNNEDNRRGLFTEESKGLTPLSLLAKGDHFWQPEAMQLLVNAGADVNASDTNGYTALHTAIYNGYWNQKVVRSLLSLGIDVNAPCQGSATTPIEAAASGKLEILKILLDHGGDRIKADSSPLFSASRQYQPEAMKVLLEVGISPKGVSKEGRPIIIHLLTDLGWRGKVPTDLNDTISLLVSYGADPNATLGDTVKDYSWKNEQPDGKSLIHLPQLIGPTLSTLISSGMDIERRDDKGRTGLMRACAPPESPYRYPGDNLEARSYSKTRNNPLAIQLVEAGANVNAVDNQGRTALHYLFSGNIEHEDEAICILAALMNAGASPLTKSNDGALPIFLSLATCPTFAPFKTMSSKFPAAIKSLDAEGNNVAYHIIKCLLSSRPRGRYHDTPASDELKIFLSSSIKDKSFSVNARNNAGNTALSQLLLDGLSFSAEDITFIKELGADFLVTNDNGEGLLHVLVKGHVARAAQDQTGMMGFISGGLLGVPGVFGLLMDEGCDETLVDGAGKTATEYADVPGHKAMAKRLNKVAEEKGKKGV
jgi:ankyrin repeat protein